MSRSHAARVFTAGLLFAVFTLCDFAPHGARAQGPGGKRARAGASARRGETGRGKEDERARALVEEGLRHADEGQWEEAIRAYKQAADIDPRFAEAYLDMGDAYMSAGKYKEGFAAYRQAIAAAPRDAEAFYSLGAAFNDMGQYGDAFKPLVSAVNLRPDYAEAHYGIGYAYLKLENYKDALPYLRGAVRLKRDYADAHLALGQAYLGLHDAKSAEGELKILSELDADSARALEKELRSAPSVASEPAKPRAVEQGDTPPKQQPAAVVKQVTPTPAPTPPRESPAAAPAQTSAAAPAQTSKPEQTSLPAQASKPAQTLPPAQTAKPEPTARPDRLLAVELSFWDSIKNSKDPEEFAAYLRKYPQGQFVELARIRARTPADRGDAAARNESPPREASASAAETAAPERPAEVAGNAAAKEPAVKRNVEPAAKTSAEPAVKASAEPAEAKGTAPAPKENAVPAPKETAEPAKVEPPKAEPAKVESAKVEPVRPARETVEPAAPVHEETPQTVEAALAQLRALFAARFTYKSDAAGPPRVSSDVTINYEPVSFEGCLVEWRDADDTLAASLSELDPAAVRVAPRKRPGTTFSKQVWDVSIAALGGRGAITETKGDGGGAVNRYNGLDLQYDDKARAERVAAALRRAIELCAGK